MWPCTTSRTRGAAPRRGPRRAAGGRLKKTYMHLYTQNVRLTRSFYPLVDVVPAALECYAFCKETRTKWRSICIRHQDFSGTQGFRYSRCVAIPGLPGDYSYFAPVSKVTGNLLSLFEQFEACFVLRQRKTATVPIEFSK